MADLSSFADASPQEVPALERALPGAWELPPLLTDRLPPVTTKYFAAFLRKLSPEEKFAMSTFLDLLLEVRKHHHVDDDWERANHKRFMALHAAGTPVPLLVKRYSALPLTPTAFRTFYEDYDEVILLEKALPGVDPLEARKALEDTPVSLTGEEVLQEALHLLPLVAILRKVASGSSWHQGVPDWMRGSRYNQATHSSALYAVQLVTHFSTPQQRRLLREGMELLVGEKDLALASTFLQVLTTPAALFVIPEEQKEHTAYRLRGGRFHVLASTYVVKRYLEELPLEEVLSLFTLFKRYLSLEGGGITPAEALYYLQHRQEVQDLPLAWWRPLAAAASSKEDN